MPIPSRCCQRLRASAAGADAKGRVDAVYPGSSFPAVGAASVAGRMPETDNQSSYRRDGDLSNGKNGWGGSRWATERSRYPGSPTFRKVPVAGSPGGDAPMSSCPPGSDGAAPGTYRTKAISGGANRVGNRYEPLKQPNQRKFVWN